MTTATVQLNDGTEMPRIGFGTNVLQGSTGVNAIRIALDSGYRLIDTAQSYDNEREVGQAIAESAVPREELYITTKITDQNQGYYKTIESYERSLEKLHLDHVDLLLVHWPNIQDFTRSISTYRAILDLREQGKVTSIGVSNYTPELIQQTIDATGDIPTVNQVEFHPFLFQEELLDYCQDNEIRIESYCPIARAERRENPLLQKLAKKYGKSTIQIILRWHLEHGLVPIPRSSDPEHIQENISIFDFSLTSDEVRAMDGLDEDYRIIHPKKAPRSW